MQIETLVVGSLGTNCYILSLAGREDVVLLDPGAQGDLISRHVGHRRVAGVVLTHGHWDHTGALSSFSDAPIYIHHQDAPMLTDPVLSAAYLFDDSAYRPPASGFLQAGQTLDIAGLRLEVVHTPGHTPGGVCLKCENDLFTGDTLFADGLHGRTDLPGGDAAQMRASLRLLRQFKGCCAWPGHGEGMVIP